MLQRAAMCAVPYLASHRVSWMPARSPAAAAAVGNTPAIAKEQYVTARVMPTMLRFVQGLLSLMCRAADLLGRTETPCRQCHQSG